MSSVLSDNFDTASIQMFRNTRSQLPDESTRDFCTVVIVLLLVLWAVRFFSRLRALRDLQTAVDTRQAVRVDGILCPQNMSKEDIVGLIRAQTTHSLHSVRTLSVGAHSRNVHLLRVIFLVQFTLILLLD